MQLVADQRYCTAGEETGRPARFSAINQSALAWQSLLRSIYLLEHCSQTLAHSHIPILTCFLSYTRVLEAKVEDSTMHNSSMCSRRAEQNTGFIKKIIKCASEISLSIGSKKQIQKNNNTDAQIHWVTLYIGVIVKVYGGGKVPVGRGRK